MRIPIALLLGGALFAASGCSSGPVPKSYTLRLSDIQGVDPIDGSLAKGPEGQAYTGADAVDLTLLGVVTKQRLVSRLEVFDLFLPEESREQLSWSERRCPESYVRNWDEKKLVVYYKAVSILIADIKRRNPDLTYETLKPGREIALPTEI